MAETEEGTQLSVLGLYLKFSVTHWQTENLYDTKTSQELERLRSLHI